jgi:hypothetical protein
MRATRIEYRGAMKSTSSALLVVLALALAGCPKEEGKPGGDAAAASASAAPGATTTTSAPAASATPSAAPSASASGPVHDCPKGTTGDGTFTKPCEATGTARMMEVAWTGKTDEKGPHFRVTNKAAEPILYGRIAVYYYDKAGKQLQAKEGDKAQPFSSCSGTNLFSGVMKPAEKAVITFSCVKKESVPDGTATIEAEMPMVGFADASEKKTEYYWRNAELAPETRKKGGGK